MIERPAMLKRRNLLLLISAARDEAKSAYVTVPLLDMPEQESWSEAL
jgi:hypothetical protein